jgi:CRISPR-associated protein Csm2
MTNPTPGNQDRRQFPPAGQTFAPNTPVLDLKNYLKTGYFNESDAVKGELLCTTALEVAKALGRANITYTQIRAFFTAARAIQRTYSSNIKFPQIVPNIERLGFLSAYYVGKGKNDYERKDREKLKEFIDSNVLHAKKDAHNFKDGFIPHFEAVMGYFKWLYPKE